MKKTIIYLVALLIATTACKMGGSGYQKAQPKKAIDSVSYAIGLQIAGQLKQSQIDSTINPELIARAIYDVMNNKKQLFGGDTITMVLMKHFDPQAFAQAQFNVEKEKKFLTENKKKSGIKTTESGLQYEVVTLGTGEKPKPESTVKVHYTGTTTDGTVFDSSVERKEPAVFPLANLIPGWKEGILLMPVGSKFKFYVPSKLAYGMQGIPQAGIGPNETLLFDVELISIEAAQPEAMNPFGATQDIH